jgi:hypothetical protein
MGTLLARVALLVTQWCVVVGHFQELGFLDRGDGNGGSNRRLLLKTLVQKGLLVDSTRSTTRT